MTNDQDDNEMMIFATATTTSEPQQPSSAVDEEDNMSQLPEQKQGVDANLIFVATVTADAADELRELQAPMMGSSLGGLTMNIFSRACHNFPAPGGEAARLYHRHHHPEAAAGGRPRGEQVLGVIDLHGTIQNVLDLCADDEDLFL